jgi:multidrug resistance protein
MLKAISASKGNGISSPSDVIKTEVESSDQEAQRAKKKDDFIISPAPETPYTVFTPREQWLITSIMGVSMLFSPMTANIYFPAIPTLANATSVSVQQINLTITTYLILQGVSPLFMGDLADKLGRRPIYLLTFAIYTAASLGLSINRTSYAALLSLRTLQSAGCSATAAISYGVLADVAMPSKRGRMLGSAMVAANVGPTLGPLLGGVITGRLGWHWIFWFLTILGATFLSAVLLAFPETSRKIVDNGSIRVQTFRQPLVALVFRYPRNTNLPPTNFPGISKSIMPNPIPAIRVIFYRDTALVLWVSAVHYAAYYCLQATMPTLFSRAPYFLTPLQTGLTYVSIGVGVALGGFVNGRTLDYNYRITAARIGFTINETAGDNLSSFPIERARTRFSLLLLPVDAILLVGYGWVCQNAITCHLAVPLVFQFILGFLQTCIVQTFNTLLVDIFPASPSTASAAGNITRCALSAGAIAAVQPLLDRLGWGWVFTILGVVAGCSSMIVTWILRCKGMGWRNFRDRSP